MITAKLKNLPNNYLNKSFKRSYRMIRKNKKKNFKRNQKKVDNEDLSKFDYKDEKKVENFVQP